MGTIRFVADAMLGSLARWLRTLGYDTHYQPSYPPGAIEALIGEGRVLLTRHRKRAVQSGRDAVLIHANDVSGQLMELSREHHLRPPASEWFSRCLRCNVLLQQAQEASAEEHVPDYVFHQNTHQIRFCPSCGRYFWPGTHRINMELQLRRWGFLPAPDSPDCGDGEHPAPVSRELDR